MAQCRVRWTKRALRRLDEIGAYVAEDDPAASELVILRIVTAVEALAIHPLLGRPGRITGTREMVLGDVSYIIAYRVVRDELAVLTVMHSAQKWPLRL
jgi:addiction module RelE/StbE family toxin